MTSVKQMMLNASAFVIYIKTFYPEVSGLTNTQFDRTILQFTKLQKDNSRRIKAHQQTVKYDPEKAPSQPLQAPAGLSCRVPGHTHRPPPGSFHQPPEGQTPPSRGRQPEPGRGMGKYFQADHSLTFSPCPAFGLTAISFQVDHHKTD
ncbi:hypothetical protein MHYP_G00172690 [Metynnis hypsauchen]